VGVHDDASTLAWRSLSRQLLLPLRLGRDRYVLAIDADDPFLPGSETLALAGGRSL